MYLRPLLFYSRAQGVIANPLNLIPMTESMNITPAQAAATFRRLEQENHLCYAFLSRVGKEYLYIQRCEDLENSDGNLDKLPSWSVGELLSGNLPFGADEAICLFADFRIEKNSDDDNEYEVEGFVEVLFPEEMQTRRLVNIFLDILGNYCELRLRKNRPFLPDEGDVAAFGFTPSEAAKLEKMLAPLNEAAACRLQAAYDKLKDIDCIRK